MCRDRPGRRRPASARSLSGLRLGRQQPDLILDVGKPDQRVQHGQRVRLAGVLGQTARAGQRDVLGAQLADLVQRRLLDLGEPQRLVRGRVLEQVAHRPGVAETGRPRHPLDQVPDPGDDAVAEHEPGRAR